MFLRFLFVVFVGLTFCSVDGQEPDPLSVPLAKENPKYLQVDLPVEQRVADLLDRMTVEEKAIALNHNGPALRRFGLRSDKWNQCLNGVQWDRPTTLFPSCIAMAATWDTELVQNDIARVMSDEARAIYNQWQQSPEIKSQHKGLIYRAPVINIGRNPYWGRNHEAFGEDPYLTGRMGVAYVRGLQGDDPRHLKTAATLKHYAVNNVETQRFSLDASVSEEMLHDYWLPHFRDSVVEAGACSLMASYNAINGTPNNINHWLLTDVLKNRWNHSGFVVSDLGGVRTMVNGHEQKRMSYVDAVAKSLTAGCDFSGPEYERYIPLALREGKITEERLNDAVRRVLTVRFRLGEFDPPESVAYHNLSPEIIGGEAHRSVALDVARKSIVLLQNKESALPLDQEELKRVAVIGPLADRVVLNNYNGRHENLVTPLAGIQRFLGDQVEVAHARGTTVTGPKDRVPTQIDQERGFSSGRSLKLDARSVGDFAEFPIEVDAAGKHAFELRYKSYPTRGQFQLSVDGNDVGQPIDMFEAEERYGLVASLGTIELTAGEHTIRLTSVGKQAASQGFSGHFDQLHLKGSTNQTIEIESVAVQTGRAKPKRDPIQEAVNLAANSDVAILFVGTDQSVEQEERDRTTLGLPGEQLKLVQKVIEANPRSVVVLKSAGPLTVPWIKQNNAAILQAWWGGEEGGTAIAEVLFGATNPSGKLPHTVYASESQVPPLDEYNIDAGFTYMHLRGEPLFAFGHGLSYTSFEYGDLSLDQTTLSADESLSIDLEVQNTGDRQGDEIVQLYVRSIESSSDDPKLRLAGFTRVEMNSGATERVHFELSPKHISRFDSSVDDFVVKPGRYEVLVGSSSQDIRSKSEFRVPAGE
ncbi:glycoside hydrolase family 3 C-terminal domain-containing protein [Rhodopirellula sp. JC740]|uniref:Glycoside hydrolase family 3 C-terminal domain-containing protein n=1 Tax=Rhodopirellula halodulae TaxID=2894198 RepID=A0ABS8NFW7_9BACT|nr:glycoside hydrolase family 3 C-terminal domain-containing protein [Rhodopirellula sp. JC740]MCC9642436.1 glycoside hydrolase family 3 C-terminal domain-containing protein [Rhodopirellula sp. JC740]